jgi:hypothetical protein
VEELGQIMVNYGVTEVIMGQFIGWARKHFHEAKCTLPRDPRSVRNRALNRHKPFQILTQSFLYIGLRYHLESLDFSGWSEISLMLTTDGLPIAKSGRGQRFWPLLMKIRGNSEHRVFVIAIFSGKD